MGAHTNEGWIMSRVMVGLFMCVILTSRFSSNFALTKHGNGAFSAQVRTFHARTGDYATRRIRIFTVEWSLMNNEYIVGIVRWIAMI